MQNLNKILTEFNQPMSEQPSQTELLELTSEIVSAHASNNTIAANDLPQVIKDVFATLLALGNEEAPVERPQPAVPIKKSILPDFLICLEDGKKLKMLKRHLMTSYNMTPEEYRKRWGLGADYPMVAPNYAKKRSTLAKKIGLGRKPGAKRKTK
jgi:predicted transcriptional regulator